MPSLFFPIHPIPTSHIDSSLVANNNSSSCVCVRSFAFACVRACVDVCARGLCVCGLPVCVGCVSVLCEV